MGGKSSKRDNHEACEACERYYEGTAAASNQGAWHPNYNLYNDGAYWHQGSKENILLYNDPNLSISLLKSILEFSVSNLIIPFKMFSF